MDIGLNKMMGEKKKKEFYICCKLKKNEREGGGFMCVKEVKPTKPPYEVGFYKFLCDGFYQTHSSKPNTIIGFHIHPFIPKPFNHTHL